MHRSGTSGVTRTLHNFGAAVPQHLIEPERDNPDGFWESRDIVRAHERFLEAIGLRWDDPRPPPPGSWDTAVAAACEAELLELLRRDFTAGSLFVIKDPRLCRLMPIWRNVLGLFPADPIVVHPVRNPLEVALSLHRRNRMPRIQALALWLAHTVCAEHDSRGLNRVFIRYDRFVADPLASARSLGERLECFSDERVEAALGDIRGQWSPKLRHHTIDDQAFLDDAGYPQWVRRAYQWMDQAAGGLEPDTAEMDEIYAGLVAATELFGPLLAVRALPVRQTRMSRWLRRLRR